MIFWSFFAQPSPITGQEAPSKTLLLTPKQGTFIDIYQGGAAEACAAALALLLEPLIVGGANQSAKRTRPPAGLLLQDAEWSQWSDREIGRRCVVHNSTVGEVRRSLSETDSEKPASTYTTKHGTVATMRTENIGRTVGGKPLRCPSGALRECSPTPRESVRQTVSEPFPIRT